MPFVELNLLILYSVLTNNSFSGIHNAGTILYHGVLDTGLAVAMVACVGNNVPLAGSYCYLSLGKWILNNSGGIHSK
jgi:hypothetical protein